MGSAAIRTVRNVLRRQLCSWTGTLQCEKSGHLARVEAVAEQGSDAESLCVTLELHTV